MFILFLSIAPTAAFDIKNTHLDIATQDVLKCVGGGTNNRAGVLITAD